MHIRPFVFGGRPLLSAYRSRLRFPVYMDNKISSNGNSTIHSAAQECSHSSLLTLYTTAISKLNSLQSNAVTIQKLRGQRELMQEQNVPLSKELLKDCGVTMTAIDGLNVIHVSGTKGKGSTSALIEIMLRSLGYKTGFYSSPHLVHARERIRINGVPISEDAFSYNFFVVYDQLNRACEGSGKEMPSYFKFLTIMAFHMFCQEKVDVAIVEVGIGGEYDCTNVVENPKVAVVTTLDYDHTSLLGTSLPQIAWHKAGIFKRNTPVVVADVIPETLEIMKQRADEKKVQSFSISPFLSEYQWETPVTRFGVAGDHQKLNISLALQATRLWLKSMDVDDKIFSDSWQSGQPFTIPQVLCRAIEQCKWPGRSQLITRKNINFHLDGAHTLKSVEMCAKWFLSSVADSKRKKVLLFHCTADRSPAALLTHLKNLGFYYAIFCPSVVNTSQDKNSDLANFNQDVNAQCERSKKIAATWKELVDEQSECMSQTCIQSSLDWIFKKATDEEPLDVLVTGSLHLIGGVISIIDPDMTMT